MNLRSRRLGAAFTTAVLAAGLAALPATATPKDAAGGHTVTICHVTNSASNPYVLITVDVAAFDGEGKNDHTHHVSKDGRVDVLADEGVCPSGTATTTTSSTAPDTGPDL